MSDDVNIVHEFDTDHGHYQVIDMAYDGRPARVLFSGQQQAAQSGLASDGHPDLLFDYNQRLFELASGLEPSRLLMIGGGMFTLPMALLEALPNVQIDAVEIDAGLPAVAAKFFGLQTNPRLTIYIDDGLRYLASSTQQYDLIIIDAFTHDIAASDLGDQVSTRHLKKLLNDGGSLAYNNIAAYYGRRSQDLRQLQSNLEDQLGRVTIYPATNGQSLWLSQNLIVVAQTDTKYPIDQYLRHQPLDSQASPFNFSRDLRQLQ
ncbi:MAG: fused MFS/spermidine synthase [Candidatus Saccharimonadales bacterium]